MRDASPGSAENTATQFGLLELALYFLRLGTFGFGGPIALVGHMQKDLVEERRRFSQQDYLQGLAFCQLSPGPLAAQLAIYLGWLRYGVLGGTLAGITFILPSFLMVMALAAFYVHFGSLSWIQGAFYGVGAAVIAIIARSAVKLVRATVGRERILWAVFLAMAITTAWKQPEIIWLFLVCGVVDMLLRAPPDLSLWQLHRLRSRASARSRPAHTERRRSELSLRYSFSSSRRERSCLGAVSPSSPFSTAAS